MTAAWISDVGVTDHALVRWLERVHGVDLERYREEIRAALVAGGFDLPQPAGDAGLYIDAPGVGVFLVVRAGVVATVLHPSTGETE
ncbi:MAG: hypothetical protein ACK4YQ_16880 [Phenylobacterium sp.]|uniref:hypothetical protein n=1 Tax=Phenylobacterium sp. TaxID=1871053 RepID=UPI00391AEAF8